MTETIKASSKEIAEKYFMLQDHRNDPDGRMIVTNILY
ncbi:MAG: hypothetical protein Dasosvirus4_26 [Dasosvirus sp.]|uniref:Uncharacterized protein n=1 Tax=Dasosvirus sp. TaxID=2487764 RepID=A0A3G4ZRL2_9VIRU|nr:MAG: hypothetical protein Dasosvirus4_26 [Dasosvirus sp.]